MPRLLHIIHKVMYKWGEICILPRQRNREKGGGGKWDEALLPPKTRELLLKITKMDGLVCVACMKCTKYE